MNKKHLFIYKILTLSLFFNVSYTPISFSASEFTNLYTKLSHWSHLKYEARYEGNKKIKPALTKTKVHIQLAPNRKKIICDEIPLPSGQTCPLEDFGKREILNFEWDHSKENFILFPNTYPYLENHILAVTKKHIPQTSMETDPQILESILDLHEEFPQLSILFNHKAGNSLEHFHVHLTSSQIPLSKKLKKQLNKTDEVLPFHFSSCMRGFFFQGNKEEIIPKLQNFIKENVTHQSLVYNLLFLPLEKDLHQIAIIVRKDPKTVLEAMNIPKTLEALDIQDFNPGASDVSGLFFLFHRQSVSNFEIELYDNVLNEFCEHGVISPDTLLKIK